MEKNSKVTITVSGPTNSGKTTLACALNDFLKLHGFDVTVHDDEQSIDTRPTDFNDACMEAVAQKSSVEIVTCHVSRLPKK